MNFSRSCFSHQLSVRNCDKTVLFNETIVKICSFSCEPCVIIFPSFSFLFILILLCFVLLEIFPDRTHMFV